MKQIKLGRLVVRHFTGVDFRVNQPPLPVITGESDDELKERFLAVFNNTLSNKYLYECLNLTGLEMYKGDIKHLIAVLSHSKCTSSSFSLYSSFPEEGKRDGYAKVDLDYKLLGYKYYDEG